MSQEVEMTAILAERPALVLTAEQYEALPPSHAELVDGVLYPMVPPVGRHQLVVSQAETLLRACCPDDLFAIREQDIYLGELHRRNPDVLVVRRASVDLDRNTFPPEAVVLAVEVVSPTSQTTDRKHKPVEYAEGGVANYWIVEPLPDLTVVTYHLDEGEAAYRRTGEFGVGQVIEIAELPWARVPVDALRPAV